MARKSTIRPTRPIEPSLPSGTNTGYRKTHLLYLVVALLALCALLLANKGLLVAAIVDGKPIWRWELTRVLTDRYGATTLEGMLSERLIAREAKKTGGRRICGCSECAGGGDRQRAGRRHEV